MKPEPDRNRRNRNFLPWRNQDRNALRVQNRIWIRIQHQKIQKIQKERTTFREIMLILTLKRQDLKFFVLDIVWIRNRNQNFSKVGTGTATNHYGSTTSLRNLIVAGYKRERKNQSSVTGSNLPTVIIKFFLNKT